MPKKKKNTKRQDVIGVQLASCWNTLITVVWKEEGARLVKNNLTLNLTTTGFVFIYSLRVLINKMHLLALIMDFSITVLLRMTEYI